MTDTAAQLTKVQLDAERDRLTRRQRQLAIVEKMVESWTEDQLDAMLAMADLYAAAAAQRLAQLRTRGATQSMP